MNKKGKEAKRQRKGGKSGIRKSESGRSMEGIEIEKKEIKKNKDNVRENEGNNNARDGEEF